MTAIRNILKSPDYRGCYLLTGKTALRGLVLCSLAVGEGYGKVYYIFSEFLDEFLEDPEGNSYIAGSFTEFLEKMENTG